MERPCATGNFHVAADQVSENLIPLVEDNRINVRQVKLSEGGWGDGHRDMLPRSTNVRNQETVGCLRTAKKVGSHRAGFRWNFGIDPATPASEMGADIMKLGAFFLAPMAAAIVGALVSWASGGFPRPVSLAIFYLLLLYGAQIVFGLAICAYLLRTNRRSVMQFGIGGLLMTAIPAALYLAWATAKHPASTANVLFVFALWSALGAMTGLCYWVLVERHGGRHY